jgi:hypothetical protein
LPPPRSSCCNCSFCRLKAGLAPTSQLIREAKEAGVHNCHDFLVLRNRPTLALADVAAARYAAAGPGRAGVAQPLHPGPGPGAGGLGGAAGGAAGGAPAVKLEGGAAEPARPRKQLFPLPAPAPAAKRPREADASDAAGGSGAGAGASGAGAPLLSGASALAVVPAAGGALDGGAVADGVIARVAELQAALAAARRATAAQRRRAEHYRERAYAFRGACAGCASGCGARCDEAAARLDAAAAAAAAVAAQPALPPAATGGVGGSSAA